MKTTSLYCPHRGNPGPIEKRNEYVFRESGTNGHHGKFRHSTSRRNVRAPLYPPAMMAALLLSAGPSPAATALSLMQKFNVFAGDYNMNGETEGPVFVAGAFNPGGTHQIGFNSRGTAQSDDDYTLWLNNGRAATGTGTTQLQSGSVISRVPLNASDFILNGNAPTGTPEIITGTPVWDTTLSTQLSLNSAGDALSLFRDASAAWAGFAPNSTATIQSGSVVFDATPIMYDGVSVAIFSLGAPGLASTISSYTLNMNGADAVLINIAGISLDVGSGKNFIGDFVGNESRVLFNFHQATAVSLNSNTRGTVFAPNATVTQNGSNLDGSVVASVFNQNAEVHYYPYVGPLPLPEPSTVSVITALGAAALLRRRRVAEVERG